MNAPMSVRYAIYFAPAADSALWRFGSHWLGYDAATGGVIEPAGMEGISPATQARVTEAPRKYGFHATLKAPFRLAEGCTVQDLNDAVRAFARSRQGFALPAMRVEQLGSFLVLRPSRRCPPVDALAAACVETFDIFRAALTPAERARRKPDTLSHRQRELLERWGYPFVLDEFAFHMSLTGSLNIAECRRIHAVLAQKTVPMCRSPVAVDSLCLFCEPEPGGAFRILARHAFGDTSGESSP